MPTLGQQLEHIQNKIRKFGKDAHCNQLVVSEEARAEAIANKPDATGKRKTRFGIETYDPAAYSAMNEAVESLMEFCGFNPILAVWIIIGLIKSAGEPGIKLLHDQLCQAHDWEAELRTAKQARKRTRKTSSIAERNKTEEHEPGSVLQPSSDTLPNTLDDPSEIWPEENNG